MVSFITCVFLWFWSKNFANTNVKELFFIYSSRSFTVSGPTLISLTQFSWFLGWKKMDQLSLAYRYPVSQHHLLKILSFLQCVFLVPLPEINWTYMRGLFLGFLFCSTGLLVNFYGSIKLFWLHIFLIQFKIKKFDATSFMILFQDCFATQGLLCFHIFLFL